jgi:hypothetical protein
MSGEIVSDLFPLAFSTGHREATTKYTKGTKNCNLWGTNSRDDILESRGEFNPKKRRADRD